MLSKEELEEEYEALGLTDRREVQIVLKTFDSDNSGGIEFNEFVAVMMNKRMSSVEERLKAAFDMVDEDGNGAISSDELLAILGNETTLYEKIMTEGDENGDGVLDFDEFTKLMKRVG